MKRETKIDTEHRPSQLVGTGGTATILARMEGKLGKFERERIEGMRLRLEQVRAHVEHLWGMSLAERKRDRRPAEKARGRHPDRRGDLRGSDGAPRFCRTARQHAGIAVCGGDDGRVRQSTAPPGPGQLKLIKNAKLKIEGKNGSQNVEGVAAPAAT